MDPVLFIMSIITAGIAGAAVLLPSSSHGRRRRGWDEDELRNQLGASSR